MKEFVMAMFLIGGAFFVLLMKLTEKNGPKKKTIRKIWDWSDNEFLEGKRDDSITDPAQSYLGCNLFHKDRYENQ
jgi:hypothetical protein